MKETPADPERKGRWRKVVLLQLVSLAVLLAVLETGFRVVHRLRGRAWEAARARSELLHVQSLNQVFTPRPENDRKVNPEDHPNAGPMLHPFLGFEVLNGARQVDDELRHLVQADPDEFDILILGGSVAAGFSEDEYGAGRLRELLSADPRLKGRALHLLKFGRSGFKEPQQANLLVYLLALGFAPEAVIAIDGFNEVALGNENAVLGTHPVFPSAAHWTHLASFSRVDREGLDIVIALREKQRAVDRLSAFALDWGLWRSCLAGSLALHRLYALRNDCIAEQERYARHFAAASDRLAVRGPTFEGGIDAAVDASVRAWFEGSRALDAICRAHSIACLQVLQPTLHDTGSKPLTPGEIERGKAGEAWVEGVHAGYPKLRAAGMRLRGLGVAFLDASLIFRDRPEDLYVDSCHFNPSGHRILADAIAAALLEAMPGSR